MRLLLQALLVFVSFAPGAFATEYNCDSQVIHDSRMGDYQAKIDLLFASGSNELIAVNGDFYGVPDSRRRGMICSLLLSQGARPSASGIYSIHKVPDSYSSEAADIVLSWKSMSQNARGHITFSFHNDARADQSFELTCVQITP